MEILKIIYVVVVVLVLFGATIFVHELGHFLFARRYKLRIERFSIGFGPKIWGFTKDGIEYRISWFPFGGYVALPQMSPLDEEEQKKFDPPVEPAKPWHKIVVAVVGAVFNIIFGLLLACVIWWVGKPVDSSQLDLTIGYVPSDSPEYRVGLREGDKIVAINDEIVRDWDDVSEAVILSQRELVKLEFERDGRRQPPIEFKPALHEVLGVRSMRAEPRSGVLVKRVVDDGPAGQAGLRIGDEIVVVDGAKVLSVGHLLDLVGQRGGKPCQFEIRRKERDLSLTITPEVPTNKKRAMIGIEPKAHTYSITVHPNPIRQVKKILVSIGNTITAFVHHKQTGVGPKDLAGPPGILMYLYYNILQDIRLGISFIVLLNINLAIINLLPIPVLDGGHILFAIVEWIRRKPMNYRFAAATQTAFAILLVSFILYVSYNDVRRFLRISSFGKSKEEITDPKFQQPHSTAPPAEGTTVPATP